MTIRILAPQRGTLREAKSVFEDLRDVLIDQTTHLPLEELFAAVDRFAPQLPDFSLIIRIRKFFRAEREFAPESDWLLLRYLSFSVKSGKLTRFATPTEAYTFYQASLADIVEQDENYCVIRARDVPKSRRLLIELISDVFNLYFHINEFNDIRDRSAARYAKILAAQFSDVLRLQDILQVLKKDRNIDSAYVWVNEGKFEYVYDHTSYPISLTPEAASLYKYALDRRMVVTGMQFEGVNRVYFAMIPFLQSMNVDRIPIGCVLITSTELIEKFDLALVSSLIKLIESGGIRDLQHTLIESIYHIRGDFLDKIRQGAARTYSERIEIFRKSLSQLCLDLTRCTSAHSCTIRLADRMKGSLNILSKAEGESSKYQSDNGGCIKLSDWKNSVNAFTFRFRLPINPVYIEDLSEPIPSDLRSLGLERARWSRKNSVSEICFPIWGSGLPIGTMNLESPRKRGFAGDVFFLGAVARHLGDLFAACDQVVDPLTLTQMTKSHELAHGAMSRNLDVDVSGLPQQVRDILDDWIRYRREFRKDIFTRAPSSRRGIAELADEIVSVINKGIPPLYKLDHRRISVEAADGGIDGALYESLRMIVQSTVVNAGKHSRLEYDTLRIKIGLNKAPNGHGLFELHYKSVIPFAGAEILDSFALSPTVKDGKVRYGAFLMGHQIRLLGGVIDLARDQPPGAAFLEYLIQIPM